MNEPATREDLEKARDAIILRLEGLREQNSQEHGSLFSKMSHLGNLMTWLKDAWRRFSILPPPPEDRKPK